MTARWRKQPPIPAGDRRTAGRPLLTPAIHEGGGRHPARLAVRAGRALRPRPQTIVTDTASYSDIVFGLLPLAGWTYAPQLADLPDQKL
ncbi:hypothetical protein GCM10009565_48170 [Amycolatopsis albidoflavus]